jgi:hypothetical protein
MGKATNLDSILPRRKDFAPVFVLDTSRQVSFIVSDHIFTQARTYMTLLRCFLFASYLFALNIAFASSSFAQDRAPQLPDAPQVERTGVPTSDVGGSVPEVRQASMEGQKARLALLSQISSKSPSGSSFMARLEDPVNVDGKPMLPKGTLVEGHLETIPARRMMRRGALRMIFDRIKLPDGTVQAARFELTAIESKSAKTDSEGTVHPTSSKKRLAIQLGGTAMVAKLADDLSEEALATTAGSAHWYGLAASTTFLLLQKGREVKLKPGEVIEVDFVRDGSTLPTGTAIR